MPRFEVWTRGHAAAMLAATACSIFLRAPWPIVVAAFASFVILLAQSRDVWAADGRTLAPNLVTALRLAIVLSLSVLLRGGPGLAWTAAILAVFALDTVDGWLARRANATTAFGARFDMETDALFILVVELELWLRGQLGAWILTTGLLRYLYVLGVAAIPPRYPDPSRSTFGRNAFGTLVTGLAVAFASPSMIGTVAAAIGSSMVAASFALQIHSSYLRRHPTAQTL